MLLLLVSKLEFSIDFMLLQVGLELVSRDFDFDSPNPFMSSDIIGLVPVCKVRLSMIQF